MPTSTENKIELNAQQQRVWLLGGLAGGLLLLVQAFFTFVINSTGTELRETNRSLVELVSTVKVHQTQIEFLREQMAQMQTLAKDGTAAHRSYELRLGSLEQRAALHDQWIQAHTK